MPRRAVLSSLLAAVLVGGARLASLPKTPWQPEELGFLEAATSFNPFLGHPQAPGYPLVVAMTRVFLVLTGNAFTAMLAMSVVASAGGAVALQRLGARVLGDEFAGLAASLAFWLSPAMSIYTALPNAEAVSALFAILALSGFVSFVTEWPMARGPWPGEDGPSRAAGTAWSAGAPPAGPAPQAPGLSGFTFGLFAAAAIGARPQVAPAIVILIVIGVFARMRSGGGLRGVVTLLVTFGLLGAGVSIPLIQAVGMDRLGSWGAASLEAIRLSSSATGLRGKDLILRLVAHPWGGKLASFPLLALAAAGVGLLARRRDPDSPTVGLFTLTGLTLFSAAHLTFCFVWGDRASGVQPVLPALIPVAILAVAPLARRPGVAVAAAVAFAAASTLYVLPVLRVRREMPSPPWMALQLADDLPGRAVVAYQPEMEHWAAAIGKETVQLRALRPFVGQPATPLYALVDGASTAPGARVFAWPATDAYGKLTTTRYRVTSLIPMPPERRYYGLRGVYDLERTISGEEWRWLQKVAEIELPTLPADAVEVSLALPSDAAVDGVSVRGWCGAEASAVRIARGGKAVLRVPLSPGCRLRLETDLAASSPRDARELAVQLLGVELKGATTPFASK